MSKFVDRGMAAIFLYTTDLTYVTQTIDDILNKTPPSLLDKIVVCNDTGDDFSNSHADVLTTRRIGRAAAWNAAAKIVKCPQLVFMKSCTKVGQHWLEPLLAKAQDKTITTPVVHSLDQALWATGVSCWRRFGWYWDLALRPRMYDGRSTSPAISSNCIVCQRDWFKYLGGFDGLLGTGAGEDLDFSLKTWLCGGRIEACDDSMIAVPVEIDRDPRTIANLARIALTWLPSQAEHFFAARALDPNDFVANRTNWSSKLNASIEWFIATFQPELVGVHSLRAIAANKKVAIIGCGPSLDHIDIAGITADIVIGVGETGLLRKCDYVICDSLDVFTELRQQYAEDQLIAPLALRTPTGIVTTNEVAPLAKQYDMLRIGSPPVSAAPPVCNFDNILLSAIQLGLFMTPSALLAYGCDGRPIGDKYQTSKIKQRSDAKREMALFDLGLSHLAALAVADRVPLVRIGHV